MNCTKCIEKKTLNNQKEKEKIWPYTFYTHKVMKNYHTLQKEVTDLKNWKLLRKF